MCEAASQAPKRSVRGFPAREQLSKQSAACTRSQRPQDGGSVSPRDTPLPPPCASPVESEAVARPGEPLSRWRVSRSDRTARDTHQEGRRVPAGRSCLPEAGPASPAVPTRHARVFQEKTRPTWNLLWPACPPEREELRPRPGAEHAGLVLQGLVLWFFLSEKFTTTVNAPWGPTTCEALGCLFYVVPFSRTCRADIMISVVLCGPRATGRSSPAPGP